MKSTVGSPSEANLVTLKIAKYIVFFLFKHIHIQENYSYTVRNSRHHTLNIYVINLCFI